MSTPNPPRQPTFPVGPPDFADVEGAPTHHPGAATIPGAGPTPTPPIDDEQGGSDPNRRSPGASNVPGAGPNPSTPD